MKNKTKTRRRMEARDFDWYAAWIVVILGCLGTAVGFYIGADWAAEHGGIFKHFLIVIMDALTGAQVGFCGTGLVALLVKFIKEVLL